MTAAIAFFAIATTTQSPTLGLVTAFGAWCCVTLLRAALIAHRT